MSILVSILILISCLKRPMLGLALLMQINIIRSLVSIDFNNPCFTCVNESDVLLGAVTPVLGLILILLRLDIRKKIVLFTHSHSKTILGQWTYASISDDALNFTKIIN